MTTATQLPYPKPPAQRDAFIGFLPRTSALVIDLVLIFFAGYTLEMALRRPLMEWGPWLPFASNVVAFAYFWLANGPLGGGATFGKAIVNLHVIDVTGDRPRIPGYGQSFRRALIQFPLIYLALTQFGRAMFDLPPLAGSLVDAVVRTVVIALVITHGYSLMTQPQRATWHDLFSGTRVTPDPTPPDLMDRLKEHGEGPLAQRVALHRTYSRYFFVAVCLVFGLAFAPILRNPHRAANMKLMETISETTPLPGYELQSAAYLSGRDYESWKTFMLQDYVPRGAAAEASGEHGSDRSGAGGGAPQSADPATTNGAAPAVADVATTDSAREPVLFLGWMKRQGSATPREIPSLAGQLEALRSAAPQYIGELEAIGVGAQAPPPTRIVCYLSDRFRFVIFSPGKGLIGFVEGPIDSREGTLSDAWYEPAP